MRLLGFLKTKHIVPEIKASNKEEVITELVGVLRDTKSINDNAYDSLVQAVLEREELGSTGLGNGFAIPHAKQSPLVDKPVGAFGRAPEGIDFGAVDGDPVNLFFLMISPEGDPDSHLQLLKRLATLGRTENFCRFLLDASKPKEILSLIEEFEDEQG